MVDRRMGRRIGRWIGLWMMVGILLGAGVSIAGVVREDHPWSALGSAVSPEGSGPLTINGLSVNPNPVSAGSQFTVNVQVSGGDPPYSYSWDSVPSGCPSPGNTPSWQCSISSPGEYMVGVNVADSGTNHTSASHNFNVTSSNGNGNGKSGSSNGNGSNGFNLSAFGPFLFYGLVIGLIAFALLVALTVGVIMIAVVLSRRLPRPPRGGLVCASCQATAPPGSKFCPSCAAPLAPPKKG